MFLHVSQNYYLHAKLLQPRNCLPATLSVARWGRKLEVWETRVGSPGIYVFPRQVGLRVYFRPAAAWVCHHMWQKETRGMYEAVEFQMLFFFWCPATFYLQFLALLKLNKLKRSVIRCCIIFLYPGTLFFHLQRSPSMRGVEWSRLLHRTTGVWFFPGWFFFVW